MIDDPNKIAESFGISDGQVVADLGVGYGHYSYALSRLVGQSGKVFAIDIQKGMIDRLKKEVDEKNIKNIEIIWGDIENIGGTKLREASVDVVLVSNVLFQTDSKAGLVHECARILKNKGKVVLIDWYESFGGVGPTPNMVVDEETAKRVFETGPFQFRKSFDAGEHHYGMIFDKKI